MFTKSGIMVGLGEERDEVLQVMDDLRCGDVDFLTIGQYLQPTRKHAEVKRFVPPEEFKALERTALAKGFLMVSASPLTRSSYHAGEDFARLRAARLRRTGSSGDPANPSCSASSSSARAAPASRPWRARWRPKLGLPVIHLDQEYLAAGLGGDASRRRGKARVEHLVAREAWVMDGNYSGSFAIRVPRADAIVWLDSAAPHLFPARGVADRAELRPGAAGPRRRDARRRSIWSSCSKWVWTYPTRSRPQHLSLIESLRGRIPSWYCRRRGRCGRSSRGCRRP